MTGSEHYQRKCPRDGSPLVEERLGEVLIDCCGECGGLFFDSGELEAVGKGSPKPFLSRRPRRDDTPSCAGCGASMQPYRFRGKVGGRDFSDDPLEIDYCPKCQSYWLDHGELGEVREILEKQGQRRIQIDDVTLGQYLVMLLAEIPLEYNEPVRRRPWATLGLVSFNLLLFGFSYLGVLYRVDPEEVRNWAGLVPMTLGPRTFYMLLTYQFAHASASHILGNLYLLYVFGDNLEDRWGRWRYLLFFLVAGVIAGLAHALHTSEPWRALVGASGAIAGLFGAYLVTFPKARVGLVLFFVPLRVPATGYLLIYFLIQCAGVLGEWLFDMAYPISVSCHAAGFAVGVVFALGMRWREGRMANRES